MTKNLFKNIFLFWFGGSTYLTFEVFYRGYSHWTMFVLAGVIFIILGQINEWYSWDTDILIQCLLGTLLSVVLEFITGCVVNLWLKWDIWDYSNLPFNLFGQICLQFTFLWFIIVLFAIIIDDIIKYKFFDGMKPQYKILNKTIKF